MGRRAGPGVRPGVRRRLVAGGFGLLVALLVVYAGGLALVDAGVLGENWPGRAVTNNLLYIVPGVLVLGRAVCARGRQRLIWGLVAGGMLSYAGGNLYWYIHLRDLAPEPLVTVGDLLWLALYPCLVVALGLLLRHTSRMLSLSSWLDGMITAAAGAALVSLPLLSTVTFAMSTSWSDVLLNLAYPVADMVLAGVLLGAWALSGWRLHRTVLPMTVGLAAFTVADGISTVQLFQGDDRSAWLDLLWSGGLGLVALAAWQPNRRVSDATGNRLWVAAAAPVVLAGACLAVLLWASRPAHGVPATTAVLAAVAITAAVVRMLMTVRAAEAVGAARREARTDDLTGLANRRRFLEHLDEALADRDPNDPLAVAFIDLDRFKEINDSFGHDAGDRLLRLVAERLAAAAGHCDVLARLGGDEFGLAVSGAVVASVRGTVDAVLDELRAPFAVDALMVHVDASVGVAVFPRDGADRSMLLRRADMAMYEAKAGRRRVAFAAPGDEDRVRDRLTVLEEFRVALDRGELMLHFQPQVTVADRRVCGMEALVRWRHPVRGVVAPDVFLPVAENAGLMDVVLAQVLELACRQAREWRDRGVAVPIAVNLSASNLLDPDLPVRVVGVLARHALPPDAIELEVTENALMRDPDGALQVLSDLRAAGMRLAVDDYGTGYSSLSYLQRLPVDDLKLDRVFVARSDTDPRSAAIVEHTVRLAHSLGLRVVAEGVENDAVLDTLARFGCDVAQGYGIARPADAAATFAWLHRDAAAVQ